MFKRMHTLISNARLNFQKSVKNTKILFFELIRLCLTSVLKFETILFIKLIGIFLADFGHIQYLYNMRGTYKITNKITRKTYIGSSMDVGDRFIRHRYRLNKGTHQIKEFIDDWKKYGKENFEFNYVEFHNISREELFAEEQKELDLAKSNPTMFYNKAFDVIGWQKYSDRSKLASSKGKIRDTNNKKIYNFIHLPTGEVFTGTCRDMYIKLQVNRGCVNRLVNWKSKSFRGWVIKERIDSFPNLFEMAKPEDYPVGKYTFTNKKANQSFSGTCYEFRVKYGVRKYRIEHMVFRNKTGDGWKCVSI